MLAARPSISVLTGCALLGAARAGAATIASVMLTCHPLPLTARVFVDASYAGDLLVAAGVPHAVGREASGKPDREGGGKAPWMRCSSSRSQTAAAASTTVMVVMKTFLRARRDMTVQV